MYSTLSDKDRKALVRWWRTGSYEGIERNTLRRLKAKRLARLDKSGLVLTLAGQNYAVSLSSRFPEV